MLFLSGCGIPKPFALLDEFVVQERLERSAKNDKFSNVSSLGYLEVEIKWCDHLILFSGT